MSTKHRVLIFLDNVDRARGLAEELQRRDLDTAVAGNTDDVRFQLDTNRVDLVVVGQELRGFLTGLDIIERLYRDLLKPVTILVGPGTAAIKEKAKQLGVDQVVPPDLGLDRLSDLIAQRLSTSTASSVLLCPAARRLVQGDVDVPPMPELILKLSNFLRDAEPSIAGIADAVSVDPRATADVLRVVNTAAMGLSRKILRIFDAVNLLGPRRIVSIVLSTSIQRVSSNLLAKMAGPDRLWFNRRSVLIAGAAHVFAERFTSVSPDTAYVLGLLQDVGVPAMFATLGHRYQQMTRHVRSVGPLRLDLVEQQELGFTHADVSGALLQKWSMPPSLITTVAYHHRSDMDRERSNVERQFTHVLQAAEALAALVEGHTAHRLPMLLRCFDAMGVDDCEAIREAMADAVTRAVRSSELFAIPIPKDDAFDKLAALVGAADDTSWSLPATPENGSLPPAPVDAASPGLTEAGLDGSASNGPGSACAATPDRTISNGSALNPSVPLAAASAPISQGVARPAAKYQDQLGHATKGSTHDAPAVMPTAAATASPARSAASASDGPSLLVVEDEEATVNSIRLFLAPTRVNIRWARTGDEALQMADDARAVLCDVHLKNEMGIEVVHVLREMGFKQPIMMMSGDRSREVIAQSILAGASDYLTKPLSPDLLLSKLRGHRVLGEN